MWLTARYAEDLAALWEGLPARMVIGRADVVGSWAKSLEEPTILVIDNYEWVTSFEADEELVKLVENAPHLRVVVLTRRSTVLDSPLTTSRVECASLDQQQLEFTNEEIGALANTRGLSSGEVVSQVVAQVGRWPLGVQAALDSLEQGFGDNSYGSVVGESLYSRSEGQLDAQILTAAARFPRVGARNLARILDLPEARVVARWKELQGLGLVQQRSSMEDKSVVPIPVAAPYLSDVADRVWTERQLSQLHEVQAKNLEVEDPAQAFRMLIQDDHMDEAVVILRRNFLRILAGSTEDVRVLQSISTEKLEDYSEILLVRLMLERGDQSRALGSETEIAEKLVHLVRQAMVSATEEEMVIFQTYLIVAERLMGQWEQSLRLSWDLLRRIEISHGATDESTHAVAIMHQVVALTGCLGGDLELAKLSAEKAYGAASLMRDETEKAQSLGLLALVAALRGERREAQGHLAKLEVTGIAPRGVSWADGDVARATAYAGSDPVEAGGALTGLTTHIEQLEHWPLIVLAEAQHNAHIHGQGEALAILEARLLRKPEWRTVSEYWRSRIVEWQINANLFVGKTLAAGELVENNPNLRDTALPVWVGAKLVDKELPVVVAAVEEATPLVLEPLDRSRLLLYGAVGAGMMDAWENARVWWSELAQTRNSLPPWFFSLVPHEWILESLSGIKNHYPTAYETLQPLVEEVENLPGRLRMVYYEPLSKAEQRVLKTLAEGVTPAATAKKLHLSQNTVKFHMRSVYRKLHVTSRDAAILRGLQLGIV